MNSFSRFTTKSSNKIFRTSPVYKRSFQFVSERETKVHNYKYKLKKHSTTRKCVSFRIKNGECLSSIIWSSVCVRDMTSIIWVWHQSFGVALAGKLISTAAWSHVLSKILSPFGNVFFSVKLLILLCFLTLRS